MTKNKPVVMFWDIETSLIIATTFSLFPERLPHDGILQDWFIISGAWKKAGEKQVHSVSVADFKRKAVDDDYEVCKALREALEGVDILIHHNGDKFDMKRLTARLIYHGLPPLPKITTIDTLKEARKVAQFTSNRLDYLGTFLIGAGKADHPQGWWLAATQGDMGVVKDMVKYNKTDVIRLEEVYNRLRPYMKNPPHFGVMLGKERGHSCQSCGSHNVKKNGIRISASGGKRQELQCQDCGHYSSVPVTLVQ